MLRKSVDIDFTIAVNSDPLMAETLQKTMSVRIDDTVYEMPEAIAAPEIPYRGMNKISKMTVNKNEINAMAALCPGLPMAVMYVARTFVIEKITTPGKRMRNGTTEPSNAGRRKTMIVGPTMNAARPAITDTLNVATAALTAICLDFSC